jgi:DNA-binding transcriptional ArsR family regulator
VKDERCALLCLDLPRAEAIRRAGLDIEAAQEAAERARALSDPTRLMLADALRKGGELCVCDLAWISERAQNLVSHHLRVLRSHDLVTSWRDGKLVMYSLTDEGRSLLETVLDRAMEASS